MSFQAAAFEDVLWLAWFFGNRLCTDCQRGCACTQARKVHCSEKGSQRMAARLSSPSLGCLNGDHALVKVAGLGENMCVRQWHGFGSTKHRHQREGRCRCKCGIKACVSLENADLAVQPSRTPVLFLDQPVEPLPVVNRSLSDPSTSN